MHDPKASLLQSSPRLTPIVLKHSCQQVGLASKELAPSVSREAAWAVVQPSSATRETTSGPAMNPSAAAAAMSAFAVAPNSNHRTAMSSRNVVTAVSMTPAATARSRS